MSFSNESMDDSRMETELADHRAAPTIIDFAPPALAAEVVPRLLSGAELSCQGFSEPDSGSDLASLRCRAVPAGGDAAP